MKQSILLLVLFLAGACAVIVDQGQPQTIRALKYEIYVYESTLHFNHGMGKWIWELYFPKKGISCSLEEELDTEGLEEEQTITINKLMWKPRLYAYFSEINNVSKVDEEEVVKPIVEVAVPYALAQEIFALAELDRKRNELTYQLGRKAVEAGILSTK